MVAGKGGEGGGRRRWRKMISLPPCVPWRHRQVQTRLSLEDDITRGPHLNCHHKALTLHLTYICVLLMPCFQCRGLPCECAVYTPYSLWRISDVVFFLFFLLLLFFSFWCQDVLLKTWRIPQWWNISAQRSIIIGRKIIRRGNHFEEGKSFSVKVGAYVNTKYINLGDSFSWFYHLVREFEKVHN